MAYLPPVVYRSIASAVVSAAAQQAIDRIANEESRRQSQNDRIEETIRSIEDTIQAEIDTGQGPGTL